VANRVSKLLKLLSPCSPLGSARTIKHLDKENGRAEGRGVQYESNIHDHPPKADIAEPEEHVRFVPITDGGDE
jgi:hypothetical protein